MTGLIAGLTDDDLFRIVRDVVEDELLRSRGASFDRAVAATWDSGTSLREGGLTLDSLERFTLAGRFNETFALFKSGVEDNLLRARTLGDTVEVIHAGLSHDAEELAFYTGGTTGSPRPQRHLSARLIQEIEYLRTVFSGRKRVVVTVPVHHIYGFLFGVLLPRALEVPAVDARFSLLTGTRAPQPGDLVVSVPFLWERFLPGSTTWPGNVWGVSSTAPLDPSTGTGLCGGVDRLTEVYGSSETGGIGLRDHCAGEEAFTLFPYWSLPEGEKRGVGTDVADETAVLWRRVGDSDAPVSYDLPDRVKVVDRRRVRPAGRRDEVVQVGGENVDLPTLQEKILSVLERAADCAVRLDANGRVKAFIVPRPGETLPPPDEIRRILHAVLPAPALPGAITVGERVPRSGTGKLLDW